MLGWIIDFVLRLWDEPVLRECLASREVLEKREGSAYLWIAYSQEFYEALSRKLGRDSGSIRRSMKRLRQIHKL